MEFGQYIHSFNIKKETQKGNKTICFLKPLY